MSVRVLAGAGVLAAVLLSVPAGAAADYLYLLAEKTEKGETTLVVLRQVPDLDRGFDRYVIEWVSVPAGKADRTKELVPRSRESLARAGQHELYMKRVAAARERRWKRLVKDGFAAVRLALDYTPGGVEEARVAVCGAEVTVRLEKGDKGWRVVVSAGGKSAVLHVMKPGEEQVGSRRLAAVAVVGEGRYLALVVRSVVLPSPENMPGDELVLVPLKAASKALGLPHPWNESACPKREEKR